MGTVIKFIFVLIPSVLVLLFLAMKLNGELSRPLHNSVCPKLSEDLCRYSIICQPSYGASSCTKYDPLQPDKPLICTDDMVYKGCM